MSELDVTILGTPIVPAAGGAAEWTLNIPNNPFWLGRSIYHQAFTPDPGANGMGLTSSIAGRGIIGR